MNTRLKRIEKAIKRIPVHHEIDPEIQATIDRVQREVNSGIYHEPEHLTPEEMDQKVEALRESIMGGKA